MLNEADPVALRFDAVTVRFRAGIGLVDPVSMEVPTGKTMALTGPNGSGKSTLVRLAAGLLTPTDGRVEWLASDRSLPLSAVRTRLGYVPQSGGLVPSMRVNDYLAYMCWMKRISRENRTAQIDRVLRIVDLTSAASRKVRTLSGGMQRRVLVAQALLGEPRSLLLDEPTAGLDAEQCSMLRAALRSIAGTTTILLATHVVEDLELADHTLALNPAMETAS